jgi:hypothetical protein
MNNISDWPVMVVRCDIIHPTCRSLIAGDLFIAFHHKFASNWRGMLEYRLPYAANFLYGSDGEHIEPSTRFYQIAAQYKIPNSNTSNSNSESISNSGYCHILGNCNTRSNNKQSRHNDCNQLITIVAGEIDCH